MVFCTADPPTPYGRASEIAFPHQVDLKCNGTDVAANLRGVKNKPGTTKPADITSLLSKKDANRENTVELVYALTNKVSSLSPPQHIARSCLCSIPFLVSDI